MKRVVAINGSHRKGKNTAFLLKTVLDYLHRDNEVQTELVELSDYKIKYCIACNKCLFESQCSIDDDDMNILAEKMINADVIIIGSPVYNGNVTSMLKTFMDRTRWMHMKRELLAGKLGAVVTVAGLRNGGQEFTHEAIERFFLSRHIKIVPIRNPEAGIYNMGVMGTLYDSLDTSKDGSPKIKWRRSVKEDSLALLTCRLLAENILRELGVLT